MSYTEGLVNTNPTLRALARETADRIAMYVSGTKWAKSGIRARVEDALQQAAALEREAHASLVQEMETLPRYAYVEVFREQWPGDSHGIVERADGDLLSREQVLALLRRSKETK